MSIARITALQRGNSSVVEHNLAKVGVAGSIPVSRSTFTFNQYLWNIFTIFVNTCPGGGMVDTRDLKSLGHCVRAGSSPAPGTTLGLRRHSQVVRQEPAKLWFPSSNLGVASKIHFSAIYGRWLSGWKRRSWKPLRVTPPGVRIPLSRPLVLSLQIYSDGCWSDIRFWQWYARRICAMWESCYSC